MMKKAEELKLSLDPFNADPQVLEQITQLATINNEEDKQFFTNFALYYGLEFIPVYSVIGSVAS